MIKTLCKPCAVYLKERGKTVTPLSGRSGKITCDACGRRRFGISYNVTGRVTQRKGG